MRIAAIFRKDLDELINEGDKTYGVFDYLRREGDTITTYVSDDALHEDLSKYDLTLFLHYPFNPGLAQALQKWEGTIPFINTPSGILQSSEKTFELTHFPHLLPITLLLSSTSDEEMMRFCREYAVIAKPVDGTGGKGIHYLGDKTEQVQEETISTLRRATSDYLFQEFIPNKGDIRILCHNGHILSYFGRYNPNAHYNNITSGGARVDIPLTAKEITLSEEVMTTMQGLGVPYLGLDVVEGRLLEVNVACPGGIGRSTPYKGDNIDDVFHRFRKETLKIVNSYPVTKSREHRTRASHE